MFIFKSIFYAFCSIRLSDRELFDHAVKGLRTPSIVCPHCHSRHDGSPTGHYQRFLIYLRSGVRTEDTVHVPLFRCPHCGYSHAVLPDLLIPFGSYSIRFVLTVLSAYYDRRGTVASVCARYQTAISTLYAWKHLFEAHYSRWCALASRLRKSGQEALSEAARVPSFPALFHASSHAPRGHCFLQGCGRRSYCLPQAFPAPPQ